MRKIASNSAHNFFDFYLKNVTWLPEGVRLIQVSLYL